MHFQDRSDAGRQLGLLLAASPSRPDIRVLALPRGGVPVAFEIARALRAPLDVWVVRKLGVPGIPELALGAIASGGVEIISTNIARRMGIPPDQIEAIAARERLELDRREKIYRGNRQPIEACGKSVVLVDDGLATGATMRAAITALRRLQPSCIVVAVPVAAAPVAEQVAMQADQFVCLHSPIDLDSVGQWYEDFSQTSDAEVCELLDRAAAFSR